ncbi:IS3 family transposase [Bacillus mycoides]
MERLPNVLLFYTYLGCTPYKHDRIKTKLKGMSPVQYRTHSSLAA